MAYEPSGSGLAGLLLAKIACCGGLVLVATGAASGLGAWLLGDGLVWVAGALAALAVGALLIRRRAKPSQASGLPAAASGTPRTGRASGSVRRG